jgi:hypothetical protein
MTILSDDAPHTRRIIMHWRTLTARVGAVLIATVLVTLTVQAVRAEDAAVLLTRAQALFVSFR